MTVPKVSVIIVSNGRPDHLPLCLESLRNQSYSSFEVIVVADKLPTEFSNHVRFIPFSDENISAARNIGVAHAASDFVAFCDDDAIPDSPWLERLIAPFLDPKIGATGGFTRGRNGISRQWGAMRFDCEGFDHPFEINELVPFQKFPPDAQNPIKIIGTNMAFRKSALVEIGGFDEAFHFFLEDADVKLRLDLAGWHCALVPNAQVHHSFAASNRRTKNRIPTDLFEVGASKAHYCKKHANEDVSEVLSGFRVTQIDRLEKLRHSERDHLIRTLDNGISEGRKRTPQYSKNKDEQPGFQKFETRTGTHILICAGLRDKKWLEQSARDLIAKGHRVSALLLTPTTLFFQLSFKDGYWLHKGGIWGKSIRTQPLIQLTSFNRRFEAEYARLKDLHNIDAILRR